MKILHVVDSINPVVGGAAVVVTSLSAALCERGHAVEIVANDHPRLGPPLAAGRAKATLIKTNPWQERLAGWSPGLAQAIARGVAECDVVHSHGLWLFANLAAAREARRQRKPLVISPHGMLESWSLGQRSWRKRLLLSLAESRNLTTAAALHATSEQEAGSIRSVLPQARPEVIANGIDPPSDVLGKGRARFFAEQPSAAGQRVLLFLSRLHPKKGLDQLLDVWERLHADFPGWTLVIAGEAERGSAFAEELRRRATPRTLWTGHLAGTEKAAAYFAADLYVLPSLSENFGVTIGEALAHGCPVLTTTETPWALLGSGDCGWQVAPDRAALEGGLRRALSLPPDTLRAMGGRGAVAVRDRFSWAKSIAPQFETLYARLILPEKRRS